MYLKVTVKVGKRMLKGFDDGDIELEAVLDAVKDAVTEALRDITDTLEDTDGTEGHDRESYSDTQDRRSYQAEEGDDQ